MNTFEKHNHSAHPEALLCEARGLAALAAVARSTGIQVPEVLAVDDESLAMTRIHPGAWNDGAWQKLGAGLAQMHAAPADGPQFAVGGPWGFDEDNYIGLNPQRNTPMSEWGEFFLHRRLRYQVGLVADSRLRESFTAVLEARGPALADFLSSCSDGPALVHGDLWRGNVLCDRDGGVWLIDPAVYFGDPEVDLAMTEMFGGFADGFYRGYGERRPRSHHYPFKRDIYNLYHYLNHFNLFGAGYLDGCERGFARLRGL